MKLEQIDQSVLERIAKIIGDGSAAAQCLQDAERRRAAGETPIFLRGLGKHRNVTFVVSQEDLDASPQ